MQTLEKCTLLIITTMALYQLTYDHSPQNLYIYEHQTKVNANSK